MSEDTGRLIFRLDPVLGIDCFVSFSLFGINSVVVGSF